jgi:hypothetical protein
MQVEQWGGAAAAADWTAVQPDHDDEYISMQICSWCRGHPTWNLVITYASVISVSLTRYFNLCLNACTTKSSIYISSCCMGASTARRVHGANLVLSFALQHLPAYVRSVAANCHIA